jgi:hypothetical protein
MEMNVEKITVKRTSMQPSPLRIMIDQNQQENVKYLNYVSSMINDARYTREIKCICHGKSTINKKKSLFCSKLDLNLRKKLAKCYTWSIALYCAGAWTLHEEH